MLLKTKIMNFPITSRAIGTVGWNKMHALYCTIYDSILNLESKLN
jgi:hypothetical protein